MPLLLGAIADDFTGATDLANTLVRQGMRTVQAIGVPDDTFDPGDAEAIVIALKSRTAPVAEAVGQSLKGLAWLKAAGVRQVFFKYCSTFDSTGQGNIGPVADALAKELGSTMAVVCPAFPSTGRTIYRGYLFVGDALLSDSSMKDHPLTPMRDSSLERLMAVQSSRRVGKVTLPTVRRGAESVRDALAALAADGVAYAVTDVLEDDDLMTIGTAIADHILVTGGSGVAMGLPANFRRRGMLGAPATVEPPRIEGREVAIAGSLSQATRGQVAHVRERWPTFTVDPARLAEGIPVVEEAIAWAETQPEGPLLFHSSHDDDAVAEVQAVLGRNAAGAMMEDALSAIAERLVAAGVRRLVVAGGETSGAVVSRLGIRGLRIGPEIDPGVPWTESTGPRPLALALKSGNFGAEDFFEKAFKILI